MTAVNIRDAALNAAKETRQAARDKAAAERENTLTVLLENWRERATLSYKGEPLPKPERDSFAWTAYPGFTYGTGRHPNVYGWTWTTDDVKFLYDATYSGQGLCVILTCPDCGEQHAEHPYGMDGLGKLLRLGRSTSHVCREVATRNLAYAIREAAEATGLSPHDIAATAAERDEAWPRR